MHRDIIIDNVLVHDLYGEDEENPGPRTELIDFGWARRIGNYTMDDHGTGKIAPEISLRVHPAPGLLLRFMYVHSFLKNGTIGPGGLPSLTLFGLGLRMRFSKKLIK